MSRFASTLTAAFLAAASFVASPLAGQTILGVLGGTGVNSQDAGAVVRIDPTTGAATVLGTPIPGESLTGVAVMNTGRVLASTATFTGPSRLIEIDPDTGALVTEIGPFVEVQSGNPVVLHDMTVDPQTGRIYGIAVSASRGGQGGDGGGATRGGTPQDENALFRIDSTTGGCTYIGTPGATSGGFLAIAALNGSIRAVPADAPVIYSINPNNGAVINTTPSSGEGALGLAVLSIADTQLLSSGCCENSTGNEIFRLDDLTGSPTLIGAAGGSRRVHDMVVLPSPIVAVEVPVLDNRGLAAMALALLALGAWLVRSR